MIYINRTTARLEIWYAIFGFVCSGQVPDWTSYASELFATLTITKKCDFSLAFRAFLQGFYNFRNNTGHCKPSFCNSCTLPSSRSLKIFFPPFRFPESCGQNARAASVRHAPEVNAGSDRAPSSALRRTFTFIYQRYIYAWLRVPGSPVGDEFPFHRLRPIF